jgi:hypothetical protein
VLTLDDNRKVRGIYQRDGDNLKICVYLGEQDGKFPSVFTGGKEHSLLLLKREKK